MSAHVGQGNQGAGRPGKCGCVLSPEYEMVECEMHARLREHLKPIKNEEAHFMRVTTPCDQLRAMFVDGVLPEEGDVIEQVVTHIDPAKGSLTTKLRVVRRTRHGS